MKKLNKDITTFQCCEFICTYERIKSDRNGNARYEVRVTYTFACGEALKTTVLVLTAQESQVYEVVERYILDNTEALK